MDGFTFDSIGGEGGFSGSSGATSGGGTNVLGNLNIGGGSNNWQTLGLALLFVVAVVALARSK